MVLFPKLIPCKTNWGIILLGKRICPARKAEIVVNLGLIYLELSKLFSSASTLAMTVSVNRVSVP